MEVFVWLLINGVFGFICSSIASGRGRDAVGWFFVGFIFGCLPIIILLALPDLKQEGEQRRRLMNENRRLRETVRKNRMVADQRYDATEKRLKAHDRALGVDTRPFDELSEHEKPPELPQAAGSDFEAHEWFYAIGNERVGPVPFESVCDAWRGGDIHLASLVWRTGFDDWVRIDSVPGMVAAIVA